MLSSLDPLQGFFEAPRPDAQNRLIGEKNWKNAAYTVVEQTSANPAKTEARAGQHEVSREIYIGADSLIHRAVVHLIVAGKPVVREIELQDVRIDPVLSAETFVFTPPAEATVIESAAPRPLLAVGAVVPDFQVEDADGKPVHLADYRGKVVLLKFFATWCWTCKESLPGTNAIARKYGNQDVVVLAVDIWNSREAFRAWTTKTSYHAIRFAHDPQAQGRDAASVLYHVTTTPTEFVIDREGKIAGISTGYEGPSAHLEHAIAALLPNRALTREAPAVAGAPQSVDRLPHPPQALPAKRGRGRAFDLPAAGSADAARLSSPPRQKPLSSSKTLAMRQCLKSRRFV